MSESRIGGRAPGGVRCDTLWHWDLGRLIGHNDARTDGKTNPGRRHFLSLVRFGNVDEQGLRLPKTLCPLQICLKDPPHVQHMPSVLHGMPRFGAKEWQRQLLLYMKTCHHFGQEDWVQCEDYPDGICKT